MQLTFPECTSRVLNRLFDSALSPSDLNFGIGRYPVRLTELGRGMMVGECWYNAKGLYSDTVNTLAHLMGASGAADSGWRRIGINCAILAGMLSAMRSKADLETGVDFAAETGDFTWIMAAWYIKQWGFPIRNLLCCCRESDGLWDLIHGGVYRADQTVPRELERLIFHLTGGMEAGWFADCCTGGTTFAASEELQNALAQTLSVYVVSDTRAESTVAGVFGRNSYILSPDAAISYAGASDHRIRNPKRATVLMISTDSPARNADTVAQSLRIPTETFLNYWKNRKIPE